MVDTYYIYKQSKQRNDYYPKTLKLSPTEQFLRLTSKSKDIELLSLALSVFILAGLVTSIPSVVKDIL